MRTSGIFEAKQNFSALIDAVEAGEEVRIKVTLGEATYVDLLVDTIQQR